MTFLSKPFFFFVILTLSGCMSFSKTTPAESEVQKEETTVARPETKSTKFRIIITPPGGDGETTDGVR